MPLLTSKVLDVRLFFFITIPISPHCNEWALAKNKTVPQGWGWKVDHSVLSGGEITLTFEARRIIKKIRCLLIAFFALLLVCWAPAFAYCQM